MTARTYTLEFKKEAVRLVLEGGYTQIEAANSLGIPKSCIQRWLSEGKIGPAQSKPEENSEQDEIKRLRKEVELLRMEREILKKATAFFAKESR
jgi:transposase